MKKIIDIFKNNQGKVFSFELFPPKTDQGYQKLLLTLDELTKLNPDFISCTYGAGGGSRDKTLEIVQLLQNKYNIVGLAHLTCVLHTKDELKNILSDIKNRGISNVLALRGDPPKDIPDWKPGSENFHYSSELCAFIKKHFGNSIGIGVAGFPEGHVLCKDRDRDAEFLKLKVDNGAEFIITQLFFDNKDYFDYVHRLQKINVNIPVLPGILPITDFKGLVKFCGVCGANIPEKVVRIFEPIQDDPEKTLKAGINFAIEQCRDLLKNGAPGIHFYCLNKISPTDKILKEIRK